MESNDMQEAFLNVIQDDHVRETINSLMSEILQKQAEEFSKVSFIERQKAVKKCVFSNTEKLLYNFRALESHLSSETEYIEMAFKDSSSSVVHYNKNKVDKPDLDQIMLDRKQSYDRSLHDYDRIKKALDTVADKKGFEIIHMRYLSDVKYTYEEIAEKLAGTDGFSDNLNEKTVRKYKNEIVTEISVLLFGTDAI